MKTLSDILNETSLVAEEEEGDQEKIKSARENIQLTSDTIRDLTLKVRAERAKLAVQKSELENLKDPKEERNPEEEVNEVFKLIEVLINNK